MKILQNLILELFFPLYIIIYTMIILIRLICALIYNLTDFIIIDHKWDFQETKDAISNLVEIPFIIYEVIIFILKN